MFIKKLFSFLLLILVVSCSTLDSSKIAPDYKEAFDSIKLIVFGDNSRLFSYEDINKIPYASILLKIGKGPEGLLILESENKEIEIFKYSGLKNSSILKILSILSIITGIFVITIFYSFSSNLKNYL